MAGVSTSGAREWFSPAEIVAARSPELPGTVQNFNRLAAAWRPDPAKARRIKGRGRSNWQYHLSALPPGAQARLALACRSTPVPAATARADDASRALWAGYDGLSAKQKAECQRRLDCLTALEHLAASGVGETAATAGAAKRFDTSPATVFNWKKMVRGVATSDRLAALAPRYQNSSGRAECHELAWTAFTSDWLRPERPSFSSCYRRVKKLASKKGWLPIPSERALRRRCEAELPRGVVALAREGRDRAKALYPAQQRVRTHFHAMQAVNMDGHRFDVFVRIGERVTRVQLLGIQDLYSGMVLAWRLSETENKETVRLVIGDMVERHGIPEKMWLDNGRAFASKWITGRMPNRYRFAIRDEDPKGILVSLGVEIQWTKPYSGQSKPIERAWRDLADTIARHPFCAGAYTGNAPDAKPENYGRAAIPIEAFREHVAREIEEHNSRAGRQAAACAGRSFRETFEASLAEPTTLIRWPSQAQRSLWLLCADRVSAQKGSGEIHFHGNRYWSVELNEYAGQKVVVRFDPDRLHQPVKVYTAEDRLICEAACIAATGFDDAAAARSHARDRGAYQKSLQEQLRLLRRMDAAELARLYGAGEKPAEPAPTPPTVKRLAISAGSVRGGGAAAQALAAPASDFEASFSRGMQLLQEQRSAEADIIPFTPKRHEDG